MALRHDVMTCHLKEDWRMLVNVIRQVKLKFKNTLLGTGKACYLIVVECLLSILHRIALDSVLISWMSDLRFFETSQSINIVF